MLLFSQSSLCRAPLILPIPFAASSPLKLVRSLSSSYLMVSLIISPFIMPYAHLANISLIFLLLTSNMISLPTSLTSHYSRSARAAQYLLTFSSVTSHCSHMPLSMRLWKVVISRSKNPWQLWFSAEENLLELNVCNTFIGPDIKISRHAPCTTANVITRLH